MRVALCSWESMYSIAVGGLAPHVSELAAALVRRGHEVHVFTRMGEGQERYERIDGVDYHRCPFEPHDDFTVYVQRMCDSFAWHLAETEAFLDRPFDLVHGHDWLAVPALVRLKNEHQRRIVFTIHSTEYGRCGNAIRDDAMSRHVRHLEWEGAYVADRVICVSKTLAKETQRCYQVPADKVSTVYNGVDVTKYDQVVDGPEVRRRHDIGARDPIVLFAGRLAWQKGPDLLLDAVPGLHREFPALKIVFAGDGDMRRGLEERASATGGLAVTRFVGHQSGSPLVDLFKTADVVCVPSRNEPFGIVILEAWSAERPVVATRIGGPAEFIQDYKTGLTVEPQVEEIRRGLQCLLSDREGSRRMGMNGRREAERRFTWDHAARATERIYQRVSNPTPRTVPAGGILRGPRPTVQSPAGKARISSGTVTSRRRSAVRPTARACAAGP